MSITRGAARTRVLQFMDAVGSSRWDVTSGGEVDQAITHTTDQEWRNILDANPYHAVVTVTVASDSDGRIAKSDITSGTGDTLKRRHKVLGMRVDDIPVDIVQVGTDYLGARIAGGAASYLVYEYGDYFQLVPRTGSVSVDIDFNYLPQKVADLAAEGSNFPFLDSFEDVPLLEAAGYLLIAKGGAEAAAAAPLVGLAKKRREEMLASTRPTTAPMEIKYTDSAAMWGV